MSPKIYVASKTKHAHIWKHYRAEGHNIISTWIDEAEEGQSESYSELADRCLKEVGDCDFLVLYASFGDILKGALIEAGAALALGKNVHYVGNQSSVSRVFQEMPEWQYFTNLEGALLPE